MIYSTTFTYDGIHSGHYGLQIADFDLSHVVENEAFNPNLSVMKVPLLLRFYHGGSEYDNPPTCEFSVICEEEIPPEGRSAILSWLVGRNEFKPLQFHTDELEGFVYYCVFSNSRTLFVNGRCHGFRLTASFDSPFCRGPEEVAAITEEGTHTIAIWNHSDIKDGYTYPTVQFLGSGITIVNKTDSLTREFKFANLESDEVLIVDNETKVITSNKSGEKLSNFISKNWLRLRQGENVLEVTSEGPVTITCPYYAMIGY